MMLAASWGQGIAICNPPGPLLAGNDKGRLSDSLDLLNNNGTKGKKGHKMTYLTIPMLSNENSAAHYVSLEGVSLTKTEDFSRYEKNNWESLSCNR